ncbi:uncharacterized protein N7484_005513 [Penicillium longicatenatum]|uniref:uncharacterized protein n=1 Tax=Penicillium longicatenatum TaxID=1561947 RepID=UPI0025498BF1|nr:uncharacterized protein N7484_005513 [Penicillium longicatenatum]KAJ5643006.1 hypothetical protein N7484_005513 [Penicillium longicatenatum]
MNTPTLNLPSTILLGAFGSSLLAYLLHRKLTKLVLNNFQQSEKWDPENELVLLTGGTSGIGKQLAEDLSNQRLRVIVLDIQTPNYPLPRNVIFYKADITSSKELAEVACLIKTEHGDPTILINNAGIFEHGTILEKTEEKIRRTYEVNNLAHYLLIKEFLPYMIRENRGHVITVASVASFVAVGEMVDYCCSKAGALVFHEGLRQELKYWYNAPNVRTSIIHPLWVGTPMIKGFTDHQSHFGQPIMSPKVVSGVIVEQIMSRRSGQIILPRHLSIAGSIRAAPMWLQEMIRPVFSKIVRRVRNMRDPMD